MALHVILHLLIYSSLIQQMFTDWSKDQAFHSSADVLSETMERSGQLVLPVNWPGEENRV